MKNMKRIEWSRLLAEAAAIVASILLAFAIDAWWADTREQEDTQIVLNAVRIEMESNLAKLRESIAHHEQIAAQIELAWKEKKWHVYVREAVVDAEVFEPSTAALDALTATGKLGSVSDPNLQVALAGIAGFVRDLNQRELRALEFRAAARLKIADIGVPIWDGTRVDQNEVVNIQVLNLLMMRRTEELEAVASARRLEAHLVSLLLMLEAFG